MTTGPKRSFFLAAYFAAFGLAGVLAYLGVDRALESKDAVQRQWAEQGAAAAEKLRDPLCKVWKGLEEEALGASDLAFTLTEAGEPLRPGPPPRAWAGFAEKGPADQKGRERFAESQRQELVEKDLVQALAGFESLAGTEYGLTLRNEARLAAGAVAYKLDRFEAAARIYAQVAQDAPQAGIAPWIRAAASFRRALCLVRLGRSDPAREAFCALGEKLHARRGGNEGYGDLHPGQKTFFLDRVGQALAGLEGGEALGAFQELAKRARTREAVYQAVRAWVVPAVARASEDRTRLTARLDGQDVIAVVVAEEEGYRGCFLHLSRLQSLAVDMAEKAGQFRLDVALADPRTKSTAQLALFEGIDGIRLEAFPRNPDAPGQEAAVRTYVLVVLVGIAGAALIAGAWLLLRKLRREMVLSRMKTDLLSEVSHDFRTPLAIIRSSAETLAMGRVTQAEKVTRYLNVIVKETHRLDDLVGNVLASVRIELGRKHYRLERLQPSALLADVEHSQGLRLAQEGVTFRVDAEKDLPVLRGDHDALRRTLDNLIENAVKFSGEHPEVTLEARRKGEAVLFRVLDRGPGIPEGEKKKIFDRFYRPSGALAAVRGVGLGLAMVLETVRVHGGTIEVEDREGGGTIFTVALSASMQDREGDDA